MGEGPVKNCEGEHECTLKNPCRKRLVEMIQRTSREQLEENYLMLIYENRALQNTLKNERGWLKDLV